MMKKVLITGATSSQCSVDAQLRSTRFGGLLGDALIHCGANVTTEVLPINCTESDVSNYESVVVGISPFTSLSAHKIYTSLNTIRLASSNARLFLYMDAPEPHLVFNSFKSVLNNPSILTKDLYSKRTGYQDVVSNKKLQNELLGTIEKILDGSYDIIIPSLPYFEASKEAYEIPEGEGTLYGFNFDSKFANDFHVNLGSKTKYWVSENSSSKWSKNIAKTLHKPVLSLKRSQYDAVGDYIYRLQESYGYLSETYKNNSPWWSPNIMLSLSCGTPVFSDWRHTGALGISWSGLPSAIEEYSHEERYVLSVAQKDSYLKNISDWGKESESLFATICL